MKKVIFVLILTTLLIYSVTAYSLPKNDINQGINPPPEKIISYTDTNIENVPDLKILLSKGGVSKVQIFFNETVNLSGVREKDLYTSVELDGNKLKIDYNQIPNLKNKNKYLKFYPQSDNYPHILEWAEFPIPLINNTFCIECTNIWTDGENLYYNINSNRATYFYKPKTELTITDSSKTQRIIQGEEIIFYANYTNVSNNQPINSASTICKINNKLMQFNSTSNLYEYTKTSETIGTNSYSIICSDDNFDTIIREENYEIEDPILTQYCTEINNSITLTSNQNCRDNPIQLTTENIFLDCNNHEITFINNTPIEVLASNITIKNCIIKDSKKGIISSNNDETIITNTNFTNNTEQSIYITNANNILIQNTKFQNTGGGIYFYQTSNSKISQIISENTNPYPGIAIYRSHNNVFENSNIKNAQQYLSSPTGQDGIHLKSCQNNTFTNITSTENGHHGVILLVEQYSNIDTKNNIFQNCNFSNNSIFGFVFSIVETEGIEKTIKNTLKNSILNNNIQAGISIYEGELGDYVGNKITTNTINYNPKGIEFKDTTISGILIESNHIEHNWQGISLRGENNTIQNNTFKNNQKGIYTFLSNGATIINNTIEGSQYYGIEISWGNLGFFEISDNQIFNNDHGIVLSEINNSQVTNNNIYDNNIGMYFFKANNNIINLNSITTNSQYGVVLNQSNDNDFQTTTIQDNIINVYQEDSTGNIFNSKIIRKSIKDVVSRARVISIIKDETTKPKDVLEEEQASIKTKPNLNNQNIYK